MNEDDKFNIQRVAVNIESIASECERAIRGGFFSIDYVREKLESVERALKALEARDTINK